MKIKWIINRAKIMNYREVFHRIRCFLYDKKIENGYRLKREVYDFNFINLPEFYGIGSEYNKEFIENTKNILNNRINIFGIDLNLNYENKFITDPLSRIKWDKNIYFKCNYKKEKLPGDVKLIWEINKQQYLLDLGLAYKITKDKIYAEKILNEINEWIEENEEYIGINWTSGLEISLRGISWIYALSLIEDYIKINNISINEILHYIRVKAEFIYNRLSLYSSANNHLIGELTFILHSAFFINCKEKNKWIKKSIELLNEQINNQFFIDGINKEQSVNYQIHTMELYFLSEYILNKNGLRLKRNAVNILKKACFYLDKISEKDGTVFNIGDEDGGHILKLQKNCSNIIDILQFGVLILNDYKIYGKKDKLIDYKILMLFGEKYLEFINDNTNFKDDDKKYYLFKKGGMFIKDGFINELPYKASIDFGEIGMAPLNAHAHSDILSFNLNIDNKPFLVDCGTYKYHNDEGFRNYFKSVKAHNTVSINRKNQFEFLGKFMNGKSPKNKIIFIDEKNIHCYSDAYKNLKCKIFRKISFGDEIIIEDIIENTSHKNIEVNQYFNFDSSVKIEVINKKIIFKNKNIKFKFVGIDDINVFYGDDSLNGGWQSKKYYSICKNYTVVTKKKVNGMSKISIITRIYS